MKKLFSLFKKRDDLEDISGYFKCEDIVEEAMAWLDAHPKASVEEYEEWLESKESSKYNKKS